MDFGRLDELLSSDSAATIDQAIADFTCSVGRGGAAFVALALQRVAVAQAGQRFDFSSETDESKRRLSRTIVGRVGELLLNDRRASQALRLIRILSRDVDLAGQLSQPPLLDSLFRAAGFVGQALAEPSVRLEAKKCCCNLLFLAKEARDHFCYYDKLASDIQATEDIHRQDLLYDVKIVFLLSGLCRTNGALFAQSQVQGALFFVLDTLLNQCIGPFTDDNVAIASETLKALFNVLSLKNSNGENEKNPLDEQTSNRMATLMKRLLTRNAVSRNREVELRINVINLLTLLNPNYYSQLFVKEAVAESSERTDGVVVVPCQGEDLDVTIIESILDTLSVQCDSAEKRQEFVRPTLVLLTNMARANRIIRRYIRFRVLPPLRDVYHRPEVGKTLRNKVVRLMTSVTDVNTVAAEFLFVLCDLNVNRLIKYTGFGNAAGLLSSVGLLTGDKATSVDLDGAGSQESDVDSDTEEYIQMRDHINPVLGCYEALRPSVTESMTEEQKEYEAMQLVDQIDKMMKQGIVVPGGIGRDGRVHPVEHILQMQEPCAAFKRNHPSKLPHK